MYSSKSIALLFVSFSKIGVPLEVAEKTSSSPRKLIAKRRYIHLCIGISFGIVEILQQHKSRQLFCNLFGIFFGVEQWDATAKLFFS
jgi:hypothetical protein